MPVEHGIIGLGPITLTVSKADLTANVLTDVLGFKEKNPFTFQDRKLRVFETGEGGAGAEIFLEENGEDKRERPGRGSVHHVAFRVESEEELRGWVDYLKKRRIPTSGFVERYYFQSLYFREPNGILFELATDGPGFEADEAFEHLGEKLSLPPYFESRRTEIEAKLKPLQTKE